MDTTNIDQKLLDKAAKLLALANRGIDGEKANAEAMLIAFLQRHNLVLEDLLSDERKEREFFILLKHQDLFWSIVLHVVPNCDGKYKQGITNKKLLWLKLTDDEYCQVTILFDHYVRQYDIAMKKARHDFMKSFEIAFIQEAKLFTHKSNMSDKPSKGRDLSLSELMQISAMMDKMNLLKHRKMLN
jgi:hypothetical protein